MRAISNKWAFLDTLLLHTQPTHSLFKVFYPFLWALLSLSSPLSLFMCLAGSWLSCLFSTDWSEQDHEQEQETSVRARNCRQGDITRALHFELSAPLIFCSAQAAWLAGACFFITLSIHPSPPPFWNFPIDPPAGRIIHRPILPLLTVTRTYTKTSSWFFLDRLATLHRHNNIAWLFFFFCPVCYWQPERSRHPLSHHRPQCSDTNMTINRMNEVIDIHKVGWGREQRGGG